MNSEGYLPPGLYEQLLTEALRRKLPHDRSDVTALPDDMYSLLAAHVAQALDRALRAPGLSTVQRVELCNRLLDEIASSGPKGAVVLQEDRIPRPPELLRAIHTAGSMLAQSNVLPRPETPLSEDALFVNAPHEPVLASELRTELLSADRVDLLCAFVVWSGVRIVLDELRAVRRRGVPIRVITTTYTGTTDPRALDELIRLGADVKVSYDTRMTRLHAKAWLFERESGFSTAYIGSSNLTHSALHAGLEWNVRLSQIHSPDLLDRFRASFETYWSDEHFVPYDRAQFETAVRRERADNSIDITLFDIVPFEYQRAMLQALEVERLRHGRWRNLIVSATGTGKTVLAAFDYKRMAEQWRGASLLFVAHRQEILEQSRRVFRHVLKDGAFGELLVGGARPVEGRHVFASIQSLSRLDVERIDPGEYDIVIVDEFHHAEASTYRRLLEHVRPQLLLGLTATPERADGKDVLQWFDGQIAVELRLWNALQQGLLCPFQYFGVADDVDLHDLEWKRTGYDIAALSRLYTGNDLRTGKILQAVHDIISDPSEMRALGFCVSVEHAEYMARSFNRAGIPSHAVTGEMDPVTRSQVVRQLRNREINVVFTVDVFNEGIDIPEVDTVLLLRPTESATIFLQQVGRGLRLAVGKSGLTILDFIGQQHRKFRFGDRLQALTGVPVRKIANAVDEGFPHLPPGCYVHLDRVAARVILDNLRELLPPRKSVMVRELADCGDVSLLQFLHATGHSLDDIYRPSVGGWMSLRRAAGMVSPPFVEGDDALVRAIARLVHIDDEERLAEYRRWMLESSMPRVSDLSPRQVRLLTMLHLDLWTRSVTPMSLNDSLERLWTHEAVRLELIAVLDVLAANAVSLTETTPGNEPLALHAHYTRDEVLAALGAATSERPPTMREGVISVAEAAADVFFVTLRKSERHFSSTTMYRDYALSPREFHWESQSTTSVGSQTGQRYLTHDQRGSRVLLFARELPEDRSFLYLGPAHYVRHSGDRPIAITWRLERDMPPAFFMAARAAS